MLFTARCDFHCSHPLFFSLGSLLPRLFPAIYLHQHRLSIDQQVKSILLSTNYRILLGRLISLFSSDPKGDKNDKEERLGFASVRLCLFPSTQSGLVTTRLFQ